MCSMEFVFWMMMQSLAKVSLGQVCCSFGAQSLETWEKTPEGPDFWRGGTCLPQGSEELHNADDPHHPKQPANPQQAQSPEIAVGAAGGIS